LNGSALPAQKESEAEDDEANNQDQTEDQTAPVEALAHSVNGLKVDESDEPTSLANGDRFEALVRDRDTLRAEVTELRKSLEGIQSKHQEDLGSVKEQLEQTQAEKEHAESQYRNLLGKVNTIKSQLGERLKADAVR
jgi:DNA repair exonuclease SbcCD ATPase subunit